MGATWSVQSGARSEQRMKSLATDLQVLEELQLRVCPELVWDDFDGAVLVHSATNALRNEMAFRLHEPSGDPSASDSYPGSSIVRFVAAWTNRGHAVASSLKELPPPLARGRFQNISWGINPVSNMVAGA